MCGIVGCFSSVPFNSKFDGVIYDMLMISTLRGLDSTGLALINTEQQREDIYKRALPAFDFLNCKVTKRILKHTAQYNVFLGHTRSATLGSIDDNSAHPFYSDNLTMVHNGTVSSFGSLKVNNSYWAQDTELLFNLLDSGEDPIKIMQEISGGTCLVWYDKQSNALKMVRNDGRPMFTGIIQDKILFFSSEHWMLEALYRQGIDVEQYEPLKENCLHTFSFLDKSIVVDKQDFEVKKIVTSVYQYTVPTNCTILFEVSEIETDTVKKNKYVIRGTIEYQGDKYSVYLYSVDQKVIDIINAASEAVLNCTANLYEGTKRAYATLKGATLFVKAQGETYSVINLDEKPEVLQMKEENFPEVNSSDEENNDSEWENYQECSFCGLWELEDKMVSIQECDLCPDCAKEFTS